MSIRLNTFVPADRRDIIVESDSYPEDRRGIIVESDSYPEDHVEIRECGDDEKFSIIVREDTGTQYVREAHALINLSDIPAIINALKALLG